MSENVRFVGVRVKINRKVTPSKFRCQSRSHSFIMLCHNLYPWSNRQNEYFQILLVYMKTNARGEEVIQAWTSRCAITPQNNSWPLFYGTMTQWPVQVWGNLYLHLSFQPFSNWSMCFSRRKFGRETNSSFTREAKSSSLIVVRCTWKKFEKIEVSGS